MDESQLKKREIKCPQCGRLTLYTPENSFRPFCSERCRVIDLGEWASESYRIPTPPSENDFIDNEEEGYEDPS
ncbi:MAG: DNA gyrase inhibitor YacG [Bdellovibrio sp.]